MIGNISRTTKKCLLCSASVIGALTLHFTCSQSGLSQVVSPFASPATMVGATGATDKSTAMRALSALELASIAAESNLHDVSLEAVRRAVGRGPVVATVNLGGLLGGGPATRSPFSSPSRNQISEAAQFQAELANKLVSLDRLWQEKKFQPQQCYELWLSLIFPPDRPSDASLYSAIAPSIESGISQFTIDGNQFTRPTPCGAELLVNWAAAAKKSGELKAFLESKSQQPIVGDIAKSVSLILSVSKDGTPEQVEKIVDEIIPRASTIFGRPGKENLFFVAMLACENLNDSSKIRAFVKAILESLRDSRATELQVRQFLRRRIQHAIELGDQSLVSDLTEIVRRTWEPLRTGNEEYVKSFETTLASSISKYAMKLNQVELALNWHKSSLSNTSSTESFGANAPILVSLTEDMPRRLLQLAPKTRYELLKNHVWGLPMLGLRSQSILAPELRAPEVFVPQTRPMDQICSRNALFASLLELTMRDAIACGATDDIERRIEHLKASGSRDAVLARFVWDLVHNRPIELNEWIVKDADGKPRLKRLVGEDELPIYAELSLIASAVRDPATRSLGIDLLTQLVSICKDKNNVSMLLTLRNELQVLSGSNAATSFPIHWVTSSNSSIDTNSRIESRQSTSKIAWAVQEGRLVQHLPTSNIFFKYPLTGDFQISMQVPMNIGGGLAGTVFSLTKNSNSISVNLGTTALPFSDYSQFSGKFDDDQNALVLTRSGGNLQGKLNGEEFFAATVQPNDSPFFTLGAGSFDKSVHYEKIAISGEPSIPSHVLLSTASLLGWTARGSNIESPGVFPNQPANRDAYVEIDGNMVRTNELVPAWRCVDGVIENFVREPEKTDNAESKMIKLGSLSDSNSARTRTASITYVRPLCDGETIELEFYYDAQGMDDSPAGSKDRFSLAPSLGNVAILLDKPEVELHWMLSGIDQHWFGIAPNNRVRDPQAEQLSPVALKQKEWNSLKLSLVAGVATLSLNGRETYRRRWTDSGQATFGLFHEPDKFQIRVRSVKLSGNWPQSLPQDILATSDIAK